MQEHHFPPNVRALLAAHDVDSANRVEPGMSGGVVYRCLLSSGHTLVLKRWPSGTRADRVAEVHHVQSIARKNGCPFVPKLYRTDSAEAATTFLRAGGAIWELADWQPGSPLDREATLGQISRGAAAIARFHQAVGDLSRGLAPPPAVIHRLRRLAELETLLPRTFATETSPKYSVPLRETIAEICSLLFGTWSIIHGRIKRSLIPRSSVLLPTQYVLRDVHREHVLFDKGTVSGLIDFDAIRIDTPLTDLTRWGGSFMADCSDPDAVWEAVMAGYLEASPFQHESEIGQAMTLIRELHHCSTWMSLANWAVWIRLECRTFAAGDDAVRARIDQLCRLARQEM